MKTQVLVERVLHDTHSAIQVSCEILEGVSPSEMDRSQRRRFSALLKVRQIFDDEIGLEPDDVEICETRDISEDWTYDE